MTAGLVGDALRAVSGLRATGGELSPTELSALADLFRPADHRPGAATPAVSTRRERTSAQPAHGPRADLPPPSHAKAEPIARQQLLRTSASALRSALRRVSGLLGATGRVAWVVNGVAVVGSFGYLAGRFTGTRWLQVAAIWAAAVVAALVILAAISVRVARMTTAWRRNPVRRVNVRAEPRPTRGGVANAAAGESGASTLPFPLDNLAWKAPRDPDPLLASRTRRAVLTLLAATRHRTGLDVARLVGERARREPLSQLPRLQVTSVRLGVQVMLERGPALEHLRSDTAGLLRGLRDVAGRHATTAVGFEQDPNWLTWPDPASAQAPWPVRVTAVLDPAVPLVVVTDFGIARPGRGELPAGGTAWARFDEDLVRRGFQPRYLVPYPRARWPQELRGMRRAGPWNDDLSIRTLQPLDRRR